MSLFKSVEAYKLMKYVNQVDGFVEWIWNSRDGVSPFMVSDRREDAPPDPRFKDRMDDVRAQALHDFPDKPEEYREHKVCRATRSMMAHDDWHEDVFLPNFVPPIGMRVFMDKADFDPTMDQFNLSVKVVDEQLFRDFQTLARHHKFGPNMERT